jgi:HlyD family secretion protein
VVFALITPPEQRADLGDGFSVFLRAVEWESDDVLAVPLSAIFREGDGWAVFVAEGTTARLRGIEIGRRNASFAEVLSGLEADDTVILHPAEEIAEGTEIEPLVPE